MSIDAARHWQALFTGWPETLPREGLITTDFQETIAFTGFMLSEGLLIVERDRPDSHGSRKVILSYDVISAVKLTSTMELEGFGAMGFRNR